jgi:response regulator RpfG family c-di-GMP phosphodiesterase
MHDFIIIDDDPINNFISKEIIGMTLNCNESVIDFTSPEEGFEYISKAYQSYRGNSVVLFLDINMPTMSGWEFLEKFSRLEEKIRDIFSVFIVSSSVDPRDKEHALANPYVKDFITKPVSEEFLSAAFGEKINRAG